MPIPNFVRSLPIFFSLFAVSLSLMNCREQPTPSEKIPTSLRIEGGAPTIYSGGALQLIAVASYSDGTVRDLSASATWTNTPARAGLVQAGGKFIATDDSVGIETVTASVQGQTASLQIEVTRRAATLSISPVIASVPSGGTLQFEASVEYQGGSQAYVTQNASWAISPGQAATIDSKGQLHALPGMTGQETVTAQFQVLSAQSQVHVQTSQTPLFEMVTIPAGSFMMGDDSSRFSDQRPAHEVFVDAFEIGKYEVTNAEYVRFLNQAFAAQHIFVESGIISGKRGPFAFLPYTKLCSSQEFPDKFIEYVQIEDDDYVFRVVHGFEDYPVVRLSWYGAAAFCAFYGYRLPTEAEWEKAARGGQQLQYGTMNGAITHDLANYTGAGGADVYAGLAPVGKFPPNPFGLYDLSGNAAEYIFDLYDASYYGVSPRNNPFGPGPARPLGRLTQQGPCASSMWRGGSWISSASACSATYRGAFCDLPEQCRLGAAVAGLRVARSLP